MKISIASLGIVQEQTAVDAYRDIVDLAQTMENFGYSRLWFAEHHGAGNSFASTTPEVLIAHIAAKTSDIRLGSGATLLNHYTPYKVAETFSALSSIAPGRIDLGLGHASGHPVANRALDDSESQHDESQTQPYEHAEEVDELLRHIHNEFPDNHPYNELALPQSGQSGPEVWLLGSSPDSAAIAGALGLPYCFAAFLNPSVAPRSFEVYYEQFEQSPFNAGPDEPKGMLGINAVCDETDESAARLRAPAEAHSQRLSNGNDDSIPCVDDAIEEINGVPDPTPNSLEPGDWPQCISGSPSTIRNLMNQMADQVGADEIIIQNKIPNPQDRIRSYELIGDVIDAG